MDENENKTSGAAEENKEPEQAKDTGTSAISAKKFKLVIEKKVLFMLSIP